MTSNLYDYHLISDLDFRKVDLRDRVMEDLAQHCAESSPVLWSLFTLQLAPQILVHEWTDDMHFQFLGFRRLIDQKGLDSTAEHLINRMNEMVQSWETTED